MNTFKICEVEEVRDDGSGRIKARVFPEDANFAISEISYSYPLLPKMFNVLPKVGECVIVFFAETGKGHSNRFYIGPLISYLQYLNFDDSFNFKQIIDDKKGENDNRTGRVFFETDPTGEVFAQKNDITIYGRRGTDIILKENDIRVRCGARISEDSYGDNDIKYKHGFNSNTLAYLKLKYSPRENIVKSEYNGTEYKYNSTATLVADQINLIGNHSNQYFNTGDPKELINDKTMEEIIAKAHVLPYGDVLVKFLKEFIWMFKNHAHTWIGHTPILPSGKESFWEYIDGNGLDKILSKSVRIN